MKEYITGIGGILFKCKDKSKTTKWYSENLGLKSESWGAVFHWREFANSTIEGSTSWGPFDNETDYFGPSGQEFMLNYRVQNMNELLQKLQADGIPVVKISETAEYGKFAWVDDVDGRRIELWEPIDSAL